MLSALIDTLRSCAACHMTTAHQRQPSIVPLVLDTRSTQSTTRLVDIKQTVSRILLHPYFFGMVWTIPSSHFAARDRRISRLSLLLTYRTWRVLFSKESLSLYGDTRLLVIFPRGYHHAFWEDGFTDMSRFYFSYNHLYATPRIFHSLRLVQNLLACLFLTFLTQLTIPFNAWTPTPLVAYAPPG